LSLYLCLTARVCWIRASGEQWQLGCSFDPPLPEEDLQRLLSEGVLDRRRSDRKRVEHRASATWELNSTPTDVAIVDLSQGGFCLRSPLPAEPASRLKLQVSSPSSLPIEAAATVQWRMQTRDGHLLGCHVSHAGTAQRLYDALAEESIVAAKPRRSRLAWYALFAALGAGLISLLPWLRS
jgi:hypothetical protein